MPVANVNGIEIPIVERDLVVLPESRPKAWQRPFGLVLIAISPFCLLIPLVGWIGTIFWVVAGVGLLFGSSPERLAMTCEGQHVESPLNWKLLAPGVVQCRVCKRVYRFRDPRISTASAVSEAD
jgi:hypothetical protein